MAKRNAVTVFASEEAADAAKAARIAKRAVTARFLDSTVRSIVGPVLENKWTKLGEDVVDAETGEVSNEEMTEFCDFVHRLWNAASTMRRDFDAQLTAEQRTGRKVLSAIKPTREPRSVSETTVDLEDLLS